MAAVERHAMRQTARLPGAGRRTAIGAWVSDDRLGTFAVYPAEAAPVPGDLYRLRLIDPAPSTEDNQAGPGVRLWLVPC